MCALRENSRDYYAPLNTLKPIGTDIWIVDGPVIGFYGMPFTTRMTVVRLENGDIFLHSPTRINDALRDEVAALGPVKYLISPNWIHYAYINEWAAAFPGAVAFAAPGVRRRARKYRVNVHFEHDLGAVAFAGWAGQIEQLLVAGSGVHREFVFFHRRSGVLVLTDLIENFEPAALPAWVRPLAKLAGISDPDGKMPFDMWMTFRKNRHELRASVERMIGWAPGFVVVAHGRCYSENCVAELRRAFRRCLV